MQDTSAIGGHSPINRTMKDIRGYYHRKNSLIKEGANNSNQLAKPILMKQRRLKRSILIIKPPVSSR